MKNIFAIIVFIILALFLSCNEEQPAYPPVLGDGVAEVISSEIVLKSSFNTSDFETVSECGFIVCRDTLFCEFTKVTSKEVSDKFSCILKNMDNGKYYAKSYARNRIGTGYSKLFSFEVGSGSDNNMLGCHEYVDLGLPSGTLWATCNIGAEKLEDYGNYYAWGETTVKETYDWTTYIYCNGSETSITKYCNKSSYGNNGFTDDLITLEASDDVATVSWGTDWRMPTYAEMNELNTNCITTDTIYNGINGRLYTGTNGNTIFLPAAGFYSDHLIDGIGYYWTSTLCLDKSNCAWVSWGGSMTFDKRNWGQSVRAVANTNEVRDESSPLIPTVSTGTSTGVTSSGVTLHGYIISDGGASIYRCGFLYGTSPSNLTRDIASPDVNNTFICSISGLSSGTTYYYKAYAKNSAGTAYGEVKQFRTTVVAVIPTVTTVSATNITTNSATLNGNVNSNGGATVTSRGFVYGTNPSNLSQNVQSGSGIGSYNKSVTGLAAGTTYYFKAYATNSVGTAYGEVKQFTTENSGATTGTLNGHDWVDLGLPSGTKWATCNVGAVAPAVYGYYYAWGETTPKSTYTSSNYTYTSNPTTLPSSADAATSNWGAGWRMPTKTEMLELIDNCTVTWTTQNGVNGCLFTGSNGNSIFLPAAGERSGSELGSAGSQGCYWSSSLSGGSSYAVSLFFNLYNCDQRYKYRYYGQSVRAVCNPR